MMIAASIKKLLDSNKYPYRAHSHKRVTSLEITASLLNINPAQILNVQVLADRTGTVLAVYPIGQKINLELCQKNLHRDFKILPAINANRIFNDCESGSWPAIGQPYHIDVIIDKSIKQLDNVYFASGSHTSLLQMPTSAYLKLNSRAKIFSFTEKLDSVDPLLQHIEASTNLETVALPQLPPIAMQIIELSLSQDHSTKELVDLVAQDPGIQQQITYYMQLPFVQEKLKAADNSIPQTEVQRAVDHVLGFDMVSHIALGVAAGRSIAASADFWRHAFYAATYAEQITKLVATEHRLDPAISYLAGLFHNFGLLLFSQLFPPEYKLLKKWSDQNPKVCITTLENRLLGMGQAFKIARGGHARLGEWLLRSWQLPEAICVITKEHHTVNYQGEYALYVNIIQLTNQLLREEGIGDGTRTGISDKLLNPLGLTAEQVYASVAQIKSGAASLENMARSLTRL